MTNTHDSIFRGTFSEVNAAGGLLRRVLPPNLAQALEWSTLSRQDGSFVDEKLVNAHADLLFSVRRVGASEAEQPVLIHVLFEHWSNPFPAAPVRVLKYEVRIMEHFVDPITGRHPAVIAVVLCHSKAGEPIGLGLPLAPGASQTGPQPFHNSIDPHPSQVPGLASFVPSFDMWVIDLAEWSDDELRGLGLERGPTLALWLLRDGRDHDRLAASFIEWGMELRAVASTPEGAMVVRYFEAVLSPLTWEGFRDKMLTISPEAEEIAMSFTQEWLEQGREQGLQQGRAEGQIATLAKQLTLKFGDQVQPFHARLAGASRDELELWTERILRAETIEDVFADP